MGTEQRLSDCISMDAVKYEHAKFGKIDKAVVTYSKTQGFYFNPKMVNLLRMEQWKQVMVGFDENSKIIVLKECDVEEFGCVKVKVVKPHKGARMISAERTRKCRLVDIGHLIRNISFVMPKHLRAERDGSMVFLKALEDNETEL